jgi:3-methyladenine DNA glycosylase AlkC
MAEALKNQFYTPPYYENLIICLREEFDLHASISKDLHALTSLELMDKMRQTAEVLQPVLEEEPFAKTVAKLERILPSGLETMWVPHWIGYLSEASVQDKLDGLKRVTVYGSSEFGIRPVLRDHWEEAYPIVLSWTHHPNEHVRRLASEGTRPLLPWGARLYAVKDHPEMTMEILEALKEDEALYVRKSVANHLNDHSKHHTAFLLEQLKNWDADHHHTRWILKHGLRTVLKSGNPKAYHILGYDADLNIKKVGVSVPDTIELGKKTFFTYALEFSAPPQNLMIDYSVQYPRPGGKQYTKVFRLKTIEKNKRVTFSGRGKLSFEEMTTRKSYPGTHWFALMLNGQTVYRQVFEVK